MQLKIYKRLDKIPAYNFHYAVDELRYLIIPKQGQDVEDIELKDKDVEQLISTYESLEDQFIKHFGVDEDYLMNWESHLEIAQLRVEMMTTNNLRLTAIINQKQKELEGSDTDESHKSFEDLVVIVSKHVGYHLNPKEIDAVMFNKYVFDFKEEMKRRERIAMRQNRA